MRHKFLVVATMFILIAILLAACVNRPPVWTIASEGEACTTATVLERDWSDSDHADFYLLLKAADGQIGYSIVNAYIYISLQVDDTICVIR